MITAKNGPNSLDEPLRTIRLDINTIRAEADYIRNELHRFTGNQEITELLAKVCEEMDGTYFDLSSEYRSLLEKLSPNGDVSGYANPDPANNLKLILSWYTETMRDFDGAVRKMRAQEDKQPLAGLAAMLLMSCGKNLFDCLASTTDAAKAVESELAIRLVPSRT